MKSKGLAEVISAIGDDRETLALVVEIAELLAGRRRKKRLQGAKRNLTR